MIEKRSHLEIGGDTVEELNGGIVGEFRVHSIIRQHKTVHTHNLVVGEPVGGARKTSNYLVMTDDKMVKPTSGGITDHKQKLKLYHLTYIATGK